MRNFTLITTGGTIEKTYDESSGKLDNRRSIVRRMLRRLRLEETRISIIELMSKDSLLMTSEDRERIAATCKLVVSSVPPPDGVIILHGTDTLAETGELLAASAWPMPIVITGAMRPFEMVRSDALQNLTEALFAAGTLGPGVYCVAHGRALSFPGVSKDRQHGTFIRAMK